MEILLLSVQDNYALDKKTPGSGSEISRSCNMMKLTSGILERNISKTYSYNKYCDAIIMKALTDVAKLLKHGCFNTNTHAERRHVQALRILILIIGAGPQKDDTELRLLLVRAGLRGIRPGLSDCFVPQIATRRHYKLTQCSTCPAKKKPAKTWPRAGRES